MKSATKISFKSMRYPTVKAFTRNDFLTEEYITSIRFLSALFAQYKNFCLHKS